VLSRYVWKRPTADEERAAAKARTAPAAKA
jgi:hypothetical protein